VSSRVVQCSNGSYRECPDGRARIEFEYHSPARFEFEFEIETGLMLWGSAEPIEAYCSGFSGGPRPAIYSARREHEPGSDEGCRSCPFGAADQTGCLVTDGRLALPPESTSTD
jgi:hypothetical protein